MAHIYMMVCDIDIRSATRTHSAALAQMTPPDDTTELLRHWDRKDARDRLFAIIYPELNRLAAARIGLERRGHTLQPSDLVNDVFLRLVRQNEVSWQGRAHFLATAARCMKHIVIDHARRRGRLRHGGGFHRVDLGEVAPVLTRDDPFERLIDLERQIEKLAARKPRLAETFDLHYFGGMTFDEIGEVLGIDPRTAKRDWEIVLQWLKSKMRVEA